MYKNEILFTRIIKKSSQLQTGGVQHSELYQLKKKPSKVRKKNTLLEKLENSIKP